MSGSSAREDLRRRWRSEGVYGVATVGQAIAAGAASHPGAAIVFSTDAGEATVTVAELHGSGLAAAAELARLGVGAGDMVILQAPTDHASLAAAVGVWHLGAALVPLPVTMNGAELATVVEQTGAACAVVSPTWRGTDLAAPLRSLVRALVVLGAESAAAAPVPRCAEPDPADVACVLYTSGSTAAPKGVRHSHETLLAGLAGPPAPTSLATFPAGHVAAVLAVLRPLMCGGTTVVMDRWSARRAADLIGRHAVVTSAGTPFFLATLLDEADRTGADISSLRLFLVGAATVPPALVARAEERGIVTWRTYGSTEHPAVASGDPTDPPEKRRLTDGRVRNGNEIRIVDESGTDLAVGADGEILCRGPKQFLGYQDPALDADAFVDGSWFRTGDRGHLDEDGHLVVTDRIKDIVIRGGENISATEVEDCLRSCPGVADVAVVAAPDPLWGESVCAFVVPAGAEREITLDALRDHAERAGLVPHKRPERLELVADLPRTSAGKVRKVDLRGRLAAAVPPASSNAPTSIGA